MKCSPLPANVHPLCENFSLGQDPFKAYVSMTVYASLSIPCTLISSFGVYLILRHSRSFLKPLRTQLLILQLISLCADFSIMELLQPTAYFPLALGHMNGPLCTVLGIPPVYALMGCVFLICCVPPAIFQVMLYKHQLLQSPGSRMKITPWKFQCITICFFSISVLVSLSVFAIGDPAGPLILNQTYPFLESYLFAENAIVVYVGDNDLFRIWGYAAIVGTLSEMLLGVLIIVSCAHTINTRVSSKTTRKYEMKLLIVLVVQIIVPMLTFALPITYSIVVFSYDLWFIQDSMKCSLLPATVSQLCENVSLGRDPFKANGSMVVYARISIPLTVVSLFRVYLILYHSRTFLKPLRTQLLILQLISFCADFSIMELLQPTAHFPLALGHMNGPICSLLKIPPTFALMGCIFLICSVPPALFQVMLYKHQLLQSPGSSLKMKPWLFKFFTVCFYSISILLSLAVFAIGDFSSAPAVLNQTYPFLASYIFAPNAVMLYVGDNALFPIWGIAIIVGTLSEVLLAVLIIASCSYTINNRLSSKTTRKYEMKLLIALVVQVVVPMLTFALPITYSFMVFYLELWFIQDYNNLAVFFVTQHSFLSTVLMICMNKPYREATTRFVLKFPPATFVHMYFGGTVKRTSDVDVSRTTGLQKQIAHNNLINERNRTSRCQNVTSPVLT